MATALKCQTLYPEGIIEIVLNKPDTVILSQKHAQKICRLDMTQRTMQVHRLGIWLVQYTFENGRGLLRLTALEPKAPDLDVRFLKGSADLTLCCGGTTHNLQATGLIVSDGSISVVSDGDAKKPAVTPEKPVPPTPAAEVLRLQQRVTELEKLLGAALDDLRDDLRKKRDNLAELNAAAANEIEQLEEQLEQAQRQKALQDSELASAREELTKAQALLEEHKQQTAQARSSTAELEKQIAELQQQALDRVRSARDLTELDEAAVSETLKEQRQQYLATEEALALLSSDPVLSCQSAADLLSASRKNIDEAHKRVVAIITLREKINDDVMTAVTGGGKISTRAEAGEA